MYPATFFGLFPAFPRDLRAFVAMSFDARFDGRWHNVLKPGIERVEINHQPMQAQRVDLSVTGDSVLTQILDDIARCRVFIADLTALGQLDGSVVRNQNVFYEIGLAHAARLPEEVLLFRSDDEPLAFDISNVRVHRYDPDHNPEGARTRVSDVITGSLRELDLRKALSVRRAAEGLDYDSWFVLAEAQRAAGVTPPARHTMGDVLSAAARVDAISRLLELGAIRSAFVRVTPEMLHGGTDAPAQELVRYHATPFGNAVFDHMVDQIGLTEPAVQHELERRASQTDKGAA